MSINGFLGGLVAITAPCYWVSPCRGGHHRRRRRRHRAVRHRPARAPPDRRPDRCGGRARLLRHLGHAGVGLFAAGEYGIAGPDGADNTAPVKGLFYGGGADQLKAQLIGSISCVSWSSARSR